MMRNKILLNTKMLQLSLFACLIILISAHTDAEHLDPMHYPMCSDKNIAITRFEMEDRMAWIGHFGTSGEVLFSRTVTGTVYRSVDGGVNWKKIDAADLGVKPGEDIISWIVPTSETKYGESQIKLYIFGQGGSFWTTVDGFTFKKHERTPRYVYPHPTKDDVALGGFRESPCEIFLTENFGETWTSAAKGTHPWWLLNDTLSFIHFSECADSSPLVTVSKETSSSEFVRFEHRGDFRSFMALSWTGYVTATPDHEQVLLATNTDDELLISRDGRHFIHAFIPIDGPQSADQYVVYGVDDGAIFVNARAQFSKQPERVGELFVSGDNTEFFTLSLPGNARQHGSYTGLGGYGDFEKVQSLDGVFVANAYAGSSDKELQTYITFDMGREWRRLTPPAFDEQGLPSTCKPAQGCFLNLFGLVDQEGAEYDASGLGRFYSVPSAVGILFGTGNTGRALDASGPVHTYFSRDAGITWEVVRAGRWAYEIADHGALLALAPRDEATNHLLYTWNEGALWEPCNFTAASAPVNIENLITETSFTSQKFLLYGDTKNSNGKTVGVLISADFSGMHERECTGANSPDTPSSDYETFDLEVGCVLGQKTTYVRRKATSQCFNPDTHPVDKRNSEICQCTELDFECGPCYTETPVEKSCRREKHCVEPTREEQCAERCYYYESDSPMPYVRIAGDVCKGGEKWESAGKIKLCPGVNPGECGVPTHQAQTSSNTPGGGGGGAVVIVLLLLVVIALVVFIGVVCKTGKPEGAYAVLSKCIPGKKEGGYRKLNLGETNDTTSFFDDDDLEQRNFD